MNFKPNSITFDYYESGYSFQLGDSVHSNIVYSMKANNMIFDYNHLTEIIKNSRKNTYPLYI